VSGLVGYALGTHALIVGVEDDPETGCLRMYLGSRNRGLYALIEEEEAKEQLRLAWGASSRGHLVVEWPPADALWTKEERP